MGCRKTDYELLIPRKYMLYRLRFIDHLMVMFGETPSWDLEQKYCPDNLEVREVLFCSSMGIGVGRNRGCSEVSLPF